VAHEGAGKETVSERTGDLLGKSLARLAGILFGEESVEGVLDLLVELARETIRGADLASVTLSRQGTLVTAGYSDELALALDRAQYEAGDGPCVQALLEGVVVHANDNLASWPALAGQAKKVGIRSVLSTPLPVRGTVVASLNLYSHSPAFEDAARQVNTLFAAPAAIALANAMAYAAASELAENLREAIATREIIGEAKGILMARQNCTSDEAFDILRRASQRTNRKLREIALDLVRSTERGHRGATAVSAHRGDLELR